MKPVVVAVHESTAGWDAVRHRGSSHGNPRVKAELTAVGRALCSDGDDCSRACASECQWSYT